MALMARIFLWISLISIGVQCQSQTNLLVTTVLDTPYTMLRDSSEPLTGNDRFEGYIVDLVEAVSNKLHFNYTLQINAAGNFGSLDQSGRWSGMIGEIIAGRAHIAAGSISITKARESAVDFTVPFMSLGVGVLYKSDVSDIRLKLESRIEWMSEKSRNGITNPQRAKKIYKRNALDDFVDLFYPFRYWSTITFFLLTLIFGIILLILRRKYKTIIFRILLGFWLLFLFIFASLYIAQLSSYFNMFTMKIDELRTIEELASLDNVSYGCIKGGSTEAFFRNSKVPLYSKMWSKMSSEPSSMVFTNTEGIERVQAGKYAFIGESTIIEYATARQCDLYQVGGLIDSKGYGLAVQQGSPLRESLSSAILQLQEEGMLSQLKNKWWHEQRGGGAC